MHHNISIVGAENSGRKMLAAKLGKIGTESDVTLYNGEFGDEYINSIVPHTYPEKIQSMIQAIAMSDYVVLLVSPKNKPDYQLGEHLIVIDYMKKPGIIVMNTTEEQSDFIVSQLKKNIKQISAGTIVEGFEILEVNLKDDSIRELQKRIEEFIPDISGDALFITDHFFDVKSVGTVLLGTLKRGSLDAYSKMTVYPLGAEALIKSMQVMDVDQKHVNAPSRPGLAVKGIKPQDLRRGFALSQAKIPIAKELSLEFKKNQFYKEDVKEGQRIRVACGAQIVDATVKEAGEALKLELDKEIALYSDIIILFRTDISGALRVVGMGKQK